MYKKEATEARRKVLDLIYKAQTSHIGSNFSCIDLMATLFERIDLDKDEFILSKGWAAASLYYFLWKKGRITEDQLNSFCMPGSKFVGLAEPVVPEIKIAGGSMGLGLPGAVGIALAKKLKGEDGKVYVLMSDGEVAIGTTWESFLIASHQKLNNLVVIIDKNGLQAMGTTKEVLDIGRLGQKLASFGIGYTTVDGHDYRQIENALFTTENSNFPSVIIASTVKGYGVRQFEGNNLYHYKAPNEEEYLQAVKELHG